MTGYIGPMTEHPLLNSKGERIDDLVFGSFSHIAHTQKSISGIRYHISCGTYFELEATQYWSESVSDCRLRIGRLKHAHIQTFITHHTEY